jgi:hypothetical protein
MLKYITRQSDIEIGLQMRQFVGFGFFRFWWLFYPFIYAQISYRYTDKKENKIFLIYKEMQKGAVAKSSRPSHIWLDVCVFPHILGSPPSYLTLQYANVISCASR